MHSSATLTIDLSRPVKSWNKNTLTRAEHLIEAFLLGSPRGCNLTSMAHISHHRHDQRWCNFFKLVPLFAQRTQNFGLFWPIHKNQVMCKPSIMVLQRYPTFSTTTTTPPAPWWWGRWAACAPGLVRPQDPGGWGFSFWSWWVEHGFSFWLVGWIYVFFQEVLVS